MIVNKIYDLLEKIDARDIKIYDVKNSSPFFDYILIATTDSERQADAFASYLKKDESLDVKNVEGKETSWLLCDLKDVLVHVFTQQDRENYALDKLYLDKEVALENIEE